MPLSSLQVIPSKCSHKICLCILCIIFCVAAVHLFSSMSSISLLPAYFIMSGNDSDTSLDGYNESGITAHFNLTKVIEKTSRYKEVSALAGNNPFTSPYVIKNRVYPSVNTSTRVLPFDAVKRNYTIVSTYNAPKWFQKHFLNMYNVGLQPCPVKECYIDTGGLLKSKADVLLFFPGKPKLPVRRPGQIWAFGSWESPEYYSYPTPYSKWKNKFNWTVSYRADADWFFPNNYLTWRDPADLLTEKEYISIAKQKTKMVAWWVSHCNTKSAREKYVKEMQKYIDVDIYGKCGSLACSKTNISKCEHLLTTTYRFYLSFENSLCLDYVSEKFFRMFAYRTQIVPVGRSGFDYNKYIPGNFVIDAKDFKSAKKLALYLKALADDIPRYAKMLREKDKLLALNRKTDWCEVCEKLRTNRYRNHTYSDIREWSHRKGLCRKPDDIIEH